MVMNIKSKILLAAGILLAQVTATSLFAQPRSPKRGFGENNLGYLADMRALAEGCTWWYNWGHTPNATHEQFLAEGGSIEFVPMAWNGGYNLETLRQYYKSHPQDKYLLGFNEPNFRAQSNMTPAQAAEKWPALEALAEELNLKLVAPALNYPDGAINDGVRYQPEEWMDGFIAAYKEQNGGREPRMDYLALHCYMDQPQAVIDFVENFAKRYDRQVWLTEFCAWEAGSLTAETQLSTMVQKLALLEQSEWVFRYAWFKARNANVYPFYNLVEYPNAARGIAAGTLTRLGFAYVHMSTFDKTRFYQPGEVIPVNAFIDSHNIKDIQWGLDPQTRDSVEIGLQGTGLSLTYQIDVPEAGEYQLLLRAARPSGNANLKARINVLDGEGNTLVSKYTMEPGEDTLTYVAYQLPITLKAGQQRITIQKDNARACNLSLIRFAKSFAADDKDLQTRQGTPRDGGSDVGPGDDPTNRDRDENWGNENVKVTVAKTSPYTFKADEKYYAVFLDEQTRKNAGIADADFVNLGDNGTSQNSYNWEGTFNYADVAGTNSFGITGNYVALEVGTKGWSGFGYNVNAAQGDLDLSGITRDYSLHMAVKSNSQQTFNLYFTDGHGHTAKIILGNEWYVEVPQGANDQHKFIPIANFERNGEWHNIDIPMSYLISKFGLDFSTATDFDGNIFCINAGGVAGTDIAFDAVFFHGPRDSKPAAETSTYDLRVSDAETTPFQFSRDERYYVIYLDGNTLNANLSKNQIRDCGPNGDNRQLYPWADTFTFPAATDANSFGVGSAYMNCRVGSAGWSGLGFFVGGSAEPQNLTGINDDFTLHFAVKTTYTGMLEFELADAMGNAGWIVLGEGDGTFEGHKILGNFPRDGKWHNIDVPIKLLANEWAVNFSTATNFTGNLFCFLAGGVAGTEVGVDAVFVYGPEASAQQTEVKAATKLDDREIAITRLTDDNRFQFRDDYDYYVLVLDGETQKNIADGHLFYLGPNGSTQNVYPWEGTLAGGDPVGDNSFGVPAGYQAWTATGQGWLGLGYNIAAAARQDLSGITQDYTLHFAVKSTSPVNYHYTVMDGNGRAAYLNLGPDNAWEENSTVTPIGDFERDDTWYMVDVPVSQLMRRGLDYATCTDFRAGNLFNITAAGTTKDGTEYGITSGVPVYYDAIFFYGPAVKGNGVEAVREEDSAPSSSSPIVLGVYDLSGRKVAEASHGRLPKGIYLVNGRKVVIR